MIIGACVLIFLLVLFNVGMPMIRFASEPLKFRDWINSKGIWGRFIYMGMVLLQVLVCVIPGEPLEIAGGYAFGTIEGTVLCILASSLGGLIVFMAVRKFGVKLVECFFPISKLNELKFLRDSSKRDLLFLILFIMPGTPKDALCFFAGLTRIPFTVFAISCSIGRLPSIITSTMGGDALGTANYKSAIIVFLIALLISLAGIYVYRRISIKEKSK